jgi:hypothetical protein
VYARWSCSTAPYFSRSPVSAYTDHIDHISRQQLQDPAIPHKLYQSASIGSKPVVSMIDKAPPSPCGSRGDDTLDSAGSPAQLERKRQCTTRVPLQLSWVTRSYGVRTVECPVAKCLRLQAPKRKRCPYNRYATWSQLLPLMSLAH